MRGLGRIHLTRLVRERVLELVSTLKRQVKQANPTSVTCHVDFDPEMSFLGLTVQPRTRLGQTDRDLDSPAPKCGRMNILRCLSLHAKRCYWYLFQVLEKVWLLEWDIPTADFARAAAPSHRDWLQGPDCVRGYWAHWRILLLDLLLIVPFSRLQSWIRTCRRLRDVRVTDPHCGGVYPLPAPLWEFNRLLFDEYGDSLSDEGLAWYCTSPGSGSSDIFRSCF